METSSINRFRIKKMAIVLLISPQELKDQTPVNGNVDEKLLKEPILYCQDNYVQNLVGTGIYNEIKAQVTAGTLTALNTTLLNDYIQPALKHWVMMESIRSLSYRYMNIGVVKKDSPNARPISDSEIQTLENNHKNKAQWYAQQAQKYLCENDTDYPLYGDPGDGIDVIPPQPNQYNTSLFLGGKRGKGRTKIKCRGWDGYYRN